MWRDGPSGSRVPQKQRIRRSREQRGAQGNGKGIWQVDDEDAQGDFDWDQPEKEKPTNKKANVADQDGYQVVKRNRTLGSYMPEIFAADRFTDRQVKVGQTLSGSSGSRIKVSSTCSALSACTSRSLGLRSRFTACEKDYIGKGVLEKCRNHVLKERRSTQEQSTR